MSAIGGIYNRNQEPVDVQLLKSISKVGQERGKDYEGIWIDSNIGFCNQLLKTTPESEKENQPIKYKHLAITFDGRIDNRAELIDKLSEANIKFGNSDPEIFIACFYLWETSCFEFILGDFALAIWDNNKKQLVCMRDIMGVKPLYYYVDHNKFVFGSLVKQLLVHPKILKKINLGMLGEHLSGFLTSLDETLYENVKKLPAKHYLIVSKDKFVVKPYWDIDPFKSICYKKSSEYVDHFYELFSNAVNSRIRGKGKIFAELSGGLDSSSVVAMLANSIDKSRIKTCSLIFPGLDCDEGKYINALVELYKLDSVSLKYKLSNSEYLAKQIKLYADLPNYSNGILNDQINAATASKSRVLFTGCGGDQILTGGKESQKDKLYKLLPGVLFKIFS